MTSRALLVRHGRRAWFNQVRRLGPPGAERSLFVNSLPKSGTHLLDQILQPLRLRRLGGFVASTPSVTLRERNEARIRSRLARSLEEELTLGHVFHSAEMEEHVRAIDLPMLFLHRDPVAVFESELFYLAEMNRWHRMHRRYRRCHGREERFDLCLHGVTTDRFYYPRFSERYERFTPWIGAAVCHTVRFEDIEAGSAAQHTAIHDLASYLETVGILVDGVDEFREAAIRAVEPRRSHTWAGARQGRAAAQLTSEERRRVLDQLAAHGRASDLPSE